MSGKLKLDRDSADNAKEQSVGAGGGFASAVGRFALAQSFGSGVKSSSDDVVTSQVKKIIQKVGAGAGTIATTANSKSQTNDDNAVNSMRAAIYTDEDNAQELGK